MAKQSIWALLMLLPMLSSCSARPVKAPRQQMPAVRVDHVIVGVSNLEAGIRDFEQLTGVRAAPGGAHPGQGTRNALLSLGEGVYLELYAPNPDEPIVSPAVAELQALTRLAPMGWAVSTTDVDGLRSFYQRRGLPLSVPEPGSRLRPDGTLLRWVTFGVETIDHPLAPFFIRWEQQALHPSRTSPSGCRLLSISLRDPAPASLAAAARPLRLPIRVGRGLDKRLEVRLACPRGTITLS
jgi:hypothetical protein